MGKQRAERALTIDSKGSNRRVKGLSMIQAKVTMKGITCSRALVKEKGEGCKGRSTHE